jgi:hypothetical protein
MFLGLLDPDLLVRSTGRILPFSHSLCLQNQIIFLDMWLRVSHKKIICKKLNNFFALKTGVVSVVGSGSISQRYGSADPDPDPH